MNRAAESMFLSRLLALPLSYLLWTHRTRVILATATVTQASFAFIANHLRWYMTAKPAGVKLHVQLCRFYSTSGLAYAELWQSVLDRSPLSVLHAGVALAALLLALVGLHNAPYMMAWGLRFATLPTTLAYVVMVSTYHLHVSSTSYLWSVVRGRAGLPLLNAEPPAMLVSPRSGRRRPVGPENPLDLAIATMFWMPLLLTLPTTFWYACFATLLHGACCFAANIVLCTSGDSSAVVGLKNWSLNDLARLVRGHPMGLEAWRPLLARVLPALVLTYLYES
jgi:hypothetical protein